MIQVNRKERNLTGMILVEQCRFDHHQKGFDQVFGHGRS